MNFVSVVKSIISNPNKFFFENLGIKQVIIKNTFWLTLAEGITRFLKLILIIYVAKILGVTEYGKFNFALAFVGIFMIFADLGISQVLIREFSRENKKESEFSAIFSLKIFLSFFTFFLIFIGSFFITHDFNIRKLIWILGIFSIIEGFSVLIYAFFQAKQKMEYPAIAKIFEAILVTIFGFFVLFYFPSVENLSYAYLLSAFLILILVWLFFQFKFFSLKISFNFLIWRQYLHLAWPLALAGLFSTIYGQTDSLVMGYLKQITQLGWYHAAYKIVSVSFIPGSLIASVFFPALSFVLFQSPEKLLKIWNYFLNSMIVLALPIVVGGMALAPKIIDWIYDPTYYNSILAFQILILLVLFSFFSYPFSQILFALNHQKIIFLITFFSAIIDVILNIILVPKYSLFGAAASSVFCAFLSFVLHFLFTVRLTPIKKPINYNFLFYFLGSCISCFLMYLTISFPMIYSLHIILLVSFGALIYFSSFFLYNFIFHPLWFKKINRK